MTSTRMSKGRLLGSRVRQLIVEVMTRNVVPDLYPYWISPSYSGKLSYIAFYLAARAICIEEKRKSGTWPLEALHPVKSQEQSEVLRDWERLNFSKDTVPSVYLVAVRLLIRRSLKCSLISSTEEAKRLVLSAIGPDLDSVRDILRFESVNSILGSLRNMQQAAHFLSLYWHQVP
ncbi:LAQU0S09e02740g1_1 [Lachancea quebecensis]|uniref:LAQU0S09e02740g1_1 n=1 Tax=Lachancea quebecensis TaxID=1654605 RepID=A0A0P1KTH1_9SACH|nr:LAQU0S09e02740g1_1 [Lachancea quebecensis]